MNPAMKMMINKMNQNPLFKQAQMMSRGKGVEQMEETCRNICKERGFDYDNMKDMFNKQMQGMRQNMPM